MPKLLASLTLALALSGCGAAHLPTGPAAAARRAPAIAGNPATAAAEAAIRASIERRVPDHFVSLQALQVTAPQGTVHAFSADEQVSGLAGSVRFHLQGQYDAADRSVKVLKREAF